MLVGSYKHGPPLNYEIGDLISLMLILFGLFPFFVNFSKSVDGLDLVSSCLMPVNRASFILELIRWGLFIMVRFN